MSFADAPGDGRPVSVSRSSRSEADAINQSSKLRITKIPTRGVDLTDHYLFEPLGPTQFEPDVDLPTPGAWLLATEDATAVLREWC